MPQKRVAFDKALHNLKNLRLLLVLLLKWKYLTGSGSGYDS